MDQQDDISYINNPDSSSEKYKSCLGLIMLLYKTYKEQENKYRVNHHITRRVESLAATMILSAVLVLSIAMLQTKFITNLKLTTFELFDYINLGFGLLIFILMAAKGVVIKTKIDRKIGTPLKKVLISLRTK